mmetsp:Transcript_7210/g.9366  ORF Transcript_7210/g.9366 Transcript_7210/m.9366 type:complete len:212 (+) Transcript_7210:62-697(+)
MKQTEEMQSIRFAHLQAALNKALIASRDHLDIEATVKEVYGEDASIFGEGNANDNNMLRQVFESMLDRIHDEVTEDMSQVLDEEQIKKMLCKLEKVMEKLETEHAMQKQLDELNKQLACQNVEAAKRPKGVDVADVINYMEMEELKGDRDMLQKELLAVEQDIQMLEEQCQEKEVDQRLLENKLFQTQQEIEKSADTGSTIGPNLAQQLRQ